jgi:NCAIR mutase (PurE)-related protein
MTSVDLTGELNSILTDVAAGRLGIGEALRLLQRADGGNGHHRAAFMNLDHARNGRTGFIEAVYCELLATRANARHAEAAIAAIPDIEYHADARLLRRLDLKRKVIAAPVGVVSAGTSDLAVAEEAALTIETVGHDPRRHYDVGVAGLHRVTGIREDLNRCGCVIVVAGMEGALPSVVAGLISRPVIAVPTSVGYGAALGGLAALLGMLAGCAPGVSVVNIDNGFGAAVAACRINTPAERTSHE